MFKFESGFVFRVQETWAQSQVERLRALSLFSPVSPMGELKGQCEGELPTDWASGNTNTASAPVYGLLAAQL